LIDEIHDWHNIIPEAARRHVPSAIVSLGADSDDNTIIEDMCWRGPIDDRQPVRRDFRSHLLGTR
jgi:hypothetical protein